MSDILYGRQPVRESLLAGRRLFRRLWLSEGVEDSSSAVLEDLNALAQQQHIHVVNVSRRELDTFVGNRRHQGVAMEVSEYPYVEQEAILAQVDARQEPAFLLLLDLVQDVQNFGTLLRTAEAAGVHGVIIQERRAAGVTPAVVNSSSGAVEHMLVAQVKNLAREIEQLKASGIWFVGLEHVPEAQPYTDVDLTCPIGLVVGSEGSGLRRLVRERCDLLMALPMRGQINTLNAAVAGSIALYEALRQRAGL